MSTSGSISFGVLEDFAEFDRSLACPSGSVSEVDPPV